MNTRQAIKYPTGGENGIAHQMLPEIEEIEVFHQKLKDRRGHPMTETYPGVGRMIEVMTLMKDLVMTDLTTGVEEEVVIDLMIDHIVQEAMIEEGEEDMLREVTEEATIEEEVDMTGDTLEVMTEEEEVDMTEEVIEDIQEGILAEVMGVREVMPQEEIEVTREDTTVDIVEADTNLEGVAIEEEEDMKAAQEITLLQEGEVTIGQENTQVLEAIQVTDLDTKIEDLHLAAILDQVIQEEVGIDLERMIAEDILRGEIILPQIVTKVGVHHLLLHLILLPVDIAVDHQLKDLIDMGK